MTRPKRDATYYAEVGVLCLWSGALCMAGVALALLVLG